jgi:hypothetical protein
MTGLQTGNDNTPCDLSLTATWVANSVNGPVTITVQFNGVLLTNSLVEPCTAQLKRADAISTMHLVVVAQAEG